MKPEEQAPDDRQSQTLASELWTFNDPVVNSRTLKLLPKLARRGKVSLSARAAVFAAAAAVSVGVVLVTSGYANYVHTVCIVTTPVYAQPAVCQELSNFSPAQN